uniref:PH01B031C15.1 protein n=1 Tax=Phyllostachys edulis TaxID=38705 RepID=L0P3X0_PHYED|nr:PH01B031C15.1 [Phyllostachys edulis]
MITLPFFLFSLVLPALFLQNLLFSTTRYGCQASGEEGMRASCSRARRPSTRRRHAPGPRLRVRSSAFLAVISLHLRALYPAPTAATPRRAAERNPHSVSRVASSSPAPSAEDRSHTAADSARRLTAAVSTRASAARMDRTRAAAAHHATHIEQHGSAGLLSLKGERIDRAQGGGFRRGVEGGHLWAAGEKVEVLGGGSRATAVPQVATLEQERISIGNQGAYVEEGRGGGGSHGGYLETRGLAGEAQRKRTRGTDGDGGG